MPEMRRNIEKLISNTLFILKGTGWYKTDYASKPADSGKKPTGKKDSGAESKQKLRRKLKQRAKQNLRQRHQLKA